MSDQFSLPPTDGLISRRSLLRGGVAATALAALSSCDSAVSAPSSPAPAKPSSRAGLNVRVSRDRYRVHVGPSVAANPRHPRQLLAACQGSPFTPEFIVTYLSVDGGASWQNGGRPAQPAAGPAGDDVTVAFGGDGRGYVCAARSGHGSDLSAGNPDADRAVYVWRTDDGGRTFSAPVTLVEGAYSDHPWVAAGPGRTPEGHNVYVAWGAGDSHTALEFTRSADGGASFEPPRRILGEAGISSVVSAGPQLARWTGRPGVRGLRLDDPAGLIGGHEIALVVAVSSTERDAAWPRQSALGAVSAAVGLRRRRPS